MIRKDLLAAMVLALFLLGTVKACPPAQSFGYQQQPVLLQQAPVFQQAPVYQQSFAVQQAPIYAPGRLVVQRAPLFVPGRAIVNVGGPGVVRVRVR